MTTPTSVKVGPYLYRLEATNALLEGENLGDCNETQTLIRYVADADPIQVRSTILHELLHACALTAPIDSGQKLDQETFIRRIEPVLLGMLRENADLVTWLSG